MSHYIAWADFLAEHSVDADQRKFSDFEEGHKHYIDIDNYPEFNATGTISQDLDSLMTTHGKDFVDEQGILPWTIIATFDSLQSAFSLRQFEKAMFFAADLGHYVGDGHMPLHLTRNYDGQYTNQDGIHSRYESIMLRKYLNQISYEGDSVRYVADISDFVFDFIYENYRYVNTLLTIEEEAALLTGSRTDDNYYSTLWYHTRDFTIQLLSNASRRLATLIYTAWVDAGSPTPDVPINYESVTAVKSFKLFQNYPNPFNPETTISFNLKKSAKIELTVYNSLGQQIAILVNGTKKAGIHYITFNANNLESGLYIYQLKVDNYINSKKMILLR